MRLLLVNMPWAALEVPSLALGILRRKALETLPEAWVEVRYANLTFADWILEHTGLTASDYEYLANTTYYLGVGDWVFSSALYDDPQWREREFFSARTGAVPVDRMGQAAALHRLVPRFIAEQAEQIVAARPDLVGFTSTFQQNVAALAIARQVKRLAPGIVTVFGGANCDGRQGAALHRNFDFLDYVCRGEAEESFPALLAALGDPDGLRRVPGLCWRDAESTSVVNAIPGHPLPPNALVPPDYTDFFAQLAASKTGSALNPVLVVEGSRGCWWGEKQHCTFCGLNGSAMRFRAKSPERFRDEVLDLVARHRVLDISVVDNILVMDYLASALPMIAEAGWDLRMHYEIKSNLRHDQLAVLARCGVPTIQPGIENLSSRVLRLMRKGVSGIQNVRLLRDAESLGMTVVWNYLYGFPGETADDYRPVLDQLPTLHHLGPASSSGRLAVERFSPYFEDPALGFPVTRPDPQYRITYDLPTAELHDLAYLFQASPRGIGRATAERVDDAVREWQRHYPASRLCWYPQGATVTLVSRRPAFDWSVRRLVDPVEVAAFRALDQPRTVSSLTRRLAAYGAGESEVEGLLRDWRALGLVFEEDGRFIHVATGGDNQDLFHLDPARRRVTPAQPEP